MSKTVVITSVNGQQQSAVASAFHQKGWIVRGTGRRAERGRYGDTLAASLETGEGLTEAFEGADAIAFTLPQDHRTGAMTGMARSVAKAAAEAGAGRLVLNIAATIAEKSDLPFFEEMRSARAAVQDASTPHAVLQPTSYMDNLLAPFCFPGIVNDAVLAYPAPEDAPISWISHRTLGDFVVAAVERNDAQGQDFRIGGPEALTGPEMAAILSEGLGKPVVYRRIPLEGFAAGLNEAFGPPFGDRIASIYSRLEREPDAMNTGDTAARALGVRPESLSDFAVRQEWRLPEKVGRD